MTDEESGARVTRTEPPVAWCPTCMWIEPVEDHHQALASAYLHNAEKHRDATTVIDEDSDSVFRAQLAADIVHAQRHHKRMRRTMKFQAANLIVLAPLELALSGMALWVWCVFTVSWIVMVVSLAFTAAGWGEARCRLAVTEATWSIVDDDDDTDP